MNSNPLLLASTAAFSLTALASADEGLQTALTVDLNGEAEGDWMLIFPAGTSYARDGRGPFILENIEHMREVIARTKDRLRTTELMVDYDHQILALPKGGTAKAAGWVKEMEARPDGIWARVEWTEAARTAIKAREYRYLSPLFSGDAKHRVFALRNLSLVNTPALDLEAVAARAIQETDMNKIAEALGLDASASEAAILAAINGQAAIVTVALSAAGLEAGATSQDLQTSLTALAAKAEDRDAVVTALSVAGDVSRDELVAAVTRTGGEGEITALTAELAQTTRKLNELTAERQKEKAVAFVDGAIREGRVGVKAQRERFIALHMKDAAEAEALIDGLPRLTNTGALATPPAKDGLTALSAEQKDAARLLGLSEKDYLETLKAEETA